MLHFSSYGSRATYIGKELTALKFTTTKNTIPLMIKLVKIQDQESNEVQILQDLAHQPTIHHLYNHYKCDSIPEHIQEGNESNIPNDFYSPFYHILELEYIENSLIQYIEKNKTKLNLVVLSNICYQVGKTLQELYEKKILHLDISFDNILVYGDNINIVPVLTNFEHSIKITSENYEYDWGGNTIIGIDSEFTAPEVKIQIDSGDSKISYLKQPSYAFGILCKKLFSNCPFDKIENDGSESDNQMKNRAKLNDLDEKIELLIKKNPYDRIKIEDALPAFDIIGYVPEEIDL